MDTPQAVLIVYALLVLVGGLIGYRKGSQASLIAGSASCAALLLALVVSLFDRGIGLWIGAGVSLLLCLTFAGRLAKTRRFMPSGMMLLVSLIALLVLAFAALGDAGG